MTGTKSNGASQSLDVTSRKWKEGSRGSSKGAEVGSFGAGTDREGWPHPGHEYTTSTIRTEGRRDRAVATEFPWYERAGTKSSDSRMDHVRLFVSPIRCKQSLASITRVGRSIGARNEPGGGLLERVEVAIIVGVGQPVMEVVSGRTPCAVGA
ncbi:hypothetical protein PM082_020869 [Marasmius tenuissimus]|nr:hypothetical protein PM082_020869 [Marasmius tenuissimus]